MEPGGHLYLEDPQETSDGITQGLLRGEMNKSLTIHEHINGYSAASVTKHVEAVGLQLVTIETRVIDYGYSTWTIVRALGRKA